MSIIYLHANLKLSIQRQRVNMIRNYYKSRQALDSLEVCANEDGTHLHTAEGALHFVEGYHIALYNLTEPEGEWVDEIRDLREKVKQLTDELRVVTKPTDT